MLYKLIAACLLANGASALSTVKVNPTTHGFVDEYSRNVIFHGMNAVYKVFPWVPTTEGFDMDNSLSDIDAANLKDWGFNVVRLGVMWPGVEPTKGAYNSTYLDEIEKIVNILADEDIYVVLDFHQDLFHRKFCGEGVPDYIYDLCYEEEPEGTAPFPYPAVQESYPLDEDGNPALDSCLSYMFATYYMSAEVGAGFQCLYENKQNTWEYFGNYWKQIATRFSTFDNVLGYELINEPWAGDVYEDPKRLLPHYTEVNYLQPLYEYLHEAIRSVDDEKIIFFEGLTIDYWNSGFTAGPGGVEYNDRQAYAYHIYCPIQDPSVVIEALCQIIDTEFFNHRINDVERIGGGMIMTEFGAAEDVRGDLYALEQLSQMMDKHQQSWMYWEFKYYQDITTCTPEGEGMYLEDGSVCDDKLQVLSRTYPFAVAGDIQSYSYSHVSAQFDMEYSPVLFNQTGAAQSFQTVVYYNQDLKYPHGVNVEVLSDSAEGLAVSCSAKNMITITQIGDLVENIVIRATPCKSFGKCTCKNI